MDTLSNDTIDDKRLDWATSPAAFRRSHQALLQRFEQLSKQLADQRALRVENAALRAGLDPDDPGVRAVLALYDGEPAPGPVHAFVLDATASLLSTARAGRSFAELAAELEPERSGAQP